MRFYVFVYTIWLKRRTPQNIVIGGAAGAFPPMIGWAAVTGSIGSSRSLVLFAIIFMWTPPHFWALALYRDGDYAKAGVPMLPVVAGRDATKPAGAALQCYFWRRSAWSPVWLGTAGLVYGGAAALSWAPCSSGWRSGCKREASEAGRPSGCSAFRSSTSSPSSPS